MKAALENPAYQQRAKTLGEQVSREDGVAAAIKILNGVLGIEKSDILNDLS